MVSFFFVAFDITYLRIPILGHLPRLEMNAGRETTRHIQTLCPDAFMPQCARSRVRVMTSSQMELIFLQFRMIVEARNSFIGMIRGMKKKVSKKSSRPAKKATKRAVGKVGTCGKWTAVHDFMP